MPYLQVAELRAAGKDPYAYSFQRTHTARQLQDEFAGLGDGEVRCCDASCLSMTPCSPANLMLLRVLHS